MQSGKQQIRSFDKNREILIDGTKKKLSEAYIMSTFKYCPLI